MGPIKNYCEEERECATTSGKFNYFSQVLAKIFAGSLPWGPWGPWAPPGFPGHPGPKGAGSIGPRVHRAHGSIGAHGSLGAHGSMEAHPGFPGSQNPFFTKKKIF